MSRQQQFRQIPRPPSGGGGGSRMPAYILFPAAAITGASILGYYAYLDEVPLTKRKRWIVSSPALEQKLGDEQYQSLLKQYHGKILPEHHRATQTVRRVGSRIANVTQDFCRQHHLHHMGTNAFTYTVVRSDTANAFVLPGNHIFVLTGLFQYVQDEDDLAAVLGHEMAHNVARHVGERLSSGVVTNVLAALLFLIDPSGSLTYLFLPTARLIHDLPHSRNAETEADRIGLQLAAQACYDPMAAKRVFTKMKEGVTKSGEMNPPEFISTHPSHDRRIQHFDEWMPQARQAFDGNDLGDTCRRIRKDMESARRLAAIQATQRETNRTLQQQQQQKHHAVKYQM